MPNVSNVCDFGHWIFGFAADALNRSGFVISPLGVLCDLGNYVSHSWDGTLAIYHPLLCNKLPF